MTTTGIADLKARLSEYLARVKAGDEVLVTDRGTPIARIVPLAARESAGAGWEELERAGLIRRPTRRLDEAFWALPRPADPEGWVRAALIAERESGW
jgi:prevent-host-death family protein